LGFQLILQEEGARISRQDQVLHGVETDIEIIPESKTYKEIGNPLRVARYHSLQVHPDSLDSLNETIKITAMIRFVKLLFLSKIWTVNSLDCNIIRNHF
jgi:anthranilate/para-aminobenzoate synthase component II